MKAYEVYMLRCSDDSYYVGVTNDAHRRFVQHQEGVDPSCYTFKRRPVVLVYVRQFRDVRNAITWEKILKRWSRKKKEALMKGDQEALERHAFSMYRKRIDHMRNRLHTKSLDVMVSPTNHDTAPFCRPSSGSG
jgi:putative endonuclease